MLLAVVLALRGWSAWIGPFPGDGWAESTFREAWRQPHWLQDATGVYQSLGTPIPALVLTALAAWALWNRGLHVELLGLGVAWLAVLSNLVLKAIFGPTQVWADAGRSGTNFPSGHTTFATAVIGYLGLLAYRHGQRELAAAALIVVLGMGPSRVISGVHLVSDVIGGYCLGIAWLVLAIVAVEKLSTPAVRRGRFGR